ncbi:MAG: hypothetical protein J7K87_02620 [Candidatus Aenigmarchaeota archaeon]|nr:hypothetical protein [Candidatus Aenigmarchaeota archaeon]
MKIKIKPMFGNGAPAIVEVGPNETIGSLKEQVGEIYNITNPKEIVLAKDGISMANNKTLSDYGLREGDTIEMTTLSVNGRPSLPSYLYKRIEKEREIVRRNNLPIQYIDGIHWIALVRARKGKWSYRTYKVSIRLPSDYPYSPPFVRFLEKVSPPHPNIYSNGHVCTSTLSSRNWNPDFNLCTVYDTLRQVLENPNYRSPVPSYLRENRRKESLMPNNLWGWNLEEFARELERNLRRR